LSKNGFTSLDRTIGVGVRKHDPAGLPVGIAAAIETVLTGARSYRPAKFDRFATRVIQGSNDVRDLQITPVVADNFHQPWNPQTKQDGCNGRAQHRFDQSRPGLTMRTHFSPDTA